MNGRPAPQAVVPATDGSVCARPLRRTGFTFASDGSYGACLARPEGGLWYTERWTLAGPEPYTVPLPGVDAEIPGRTILLPLTDGRVLVCRRGDDGYRLALIYPAGPSTAELSVGTLPPYDVRLLPLPSSGQRTARAAWRADPAVALAVSRSSGESGTHTTSIWLVSSASGSDPHAAPRPHRLIELPGRHLGGIWLDQGGRLLALDRVDEGRKKTVVLDMDTGLTSPLLQIGEDSDDRLILADPQSGLLVVRSNAPGSDRLGWGVLGSERPLRFPESLALPGAAVTPFAVQPGAPLTPEECGVAVRVKERGETRLAVWRPAGGSLDPLPPPQGWFVDTGHWSTEGLRLPYAHAGCPFGVALFAGKAAGDIPGRPKKVASGRTRGYAPTRGAGGNPRLQPGGSFSPGGGS